MMTDHKTSKKIYTIILTAVLIYGAFFSVVAEIAFAEAVAQDAEPKIEAPADPKETPEPKSSDSPSVGDTSDTGFDAEKKENVLEKKDGDAGAGDGAGNDVEKKLDDPTPSDKDRSANEQTLAKPDAQTPDKDGAEPEAPANGVQNGDSDNNNGNNNGGNNTGGNNTDGRTDDHKILDEEKPTEEKTLVDRFELNDTRALDQKYTTIRELSGTVIYKDFFYIFDEGAYGTESMTIVISYNHNNKNYKRSFRIHHNHDGSWTGNLPWGVQIVNNDLIVRGWLMVNKTYIDIIDHSIISGIDSDADGSYEAPEYEPPTPVAPEATHAETAGGNDTSVVNTVTTVPEIVTNPVQVVAPAYAAETLVNDPVQKDTELVNSVLSSYQNAADVAITDETNDGDSPINATTAMLAGVAAMFLITMALVIVPKV